MTVYNYDLYDTVDIANLKVGDAIKVVDEDILIKSIDKGEYGELNINGGIDNEGITLQPGDGGTYYEILMNDMKHYYEIGKTILPVAQEFTLRDSSNHNIPEQTLLAGDLINGLDKVYADFQPTNTLVTVQDGFITEMSHIYTP